MLGFDVGYIINFIILLFQWLHVPLKWIGGDIWNTSCEFQMVPRGIESWRLSDLDGLLVLRFTFVMKA